MMTIASRAAAAAAISLLLAGSAFAQAPASPAPAATPAPAKASKAHSPESLECSKQADDKGLKGRERKKFRKECMKEAKGAAPKQ